jgi:hypothetical protein
MKAHQFEGGQIYDKYMAYCCEIINAWESFNAENNSVLCEMSLSMHNNNVLTENLKRFEAIFGSKSQ